MGVLSFEEQELSWHIFCFYTSTYTYTYTVTRIKCSSNLLHIYGHQRGRAKYLHYNEYYRGFQTIVMNSGFFNLLTDTSTNYGVIRLCRSCKLNTLYFKLSYSPLLTWQQLQRKTLLCFQDLDLLRYLTSHFLRSLTLWCETVPGPCSFPLKIQWVMSWSGENTHKVVSNETIWKW